tara:strand:- start:470 stop:685 length:216 start_codon:yes stop_codon:yes gene_type:complete
MARHDPIKIASSCGHASESQPVGTDLTAILISSVFLGVGFVIAKFFPEAALLAAVFLVGLAILNIALVMVA